MVLFYAHGLLQYLRDRKGRFWQWSFFNFIFFLWNDSMNSVLILNHGGTIIYDTAQQSAEHLGDKREIQFLPLLLTKDMIKANFHDRVNYVECGRKTIAFWEVRRPLQTLPVYSFLSWILEAWFAVYSPSRARACSSGLFAALLSNDTPVLTIYPWSTVAGELQAEGKVEIVICSDIKYVIAAAVDIWNDASVVFSWYAWMCGTGWTPRGP